jgi:hypothetical protein
VPSTTSAAAAAGEPIKSLLAGSPKQHLSGQDGANDDERAAAHPKMGIGHGQPRREEGKEMEN